MSTLSFILAKPCLVIPNTSPYKYHWERSQKIFKMKQKIAALHYLTKQKNFFQFNISIFSINTLVLRKVVPL